jgi:DNA polymerase-4
VAGQGRRGEVIVGGPPVPAADLERLTILHADMDAFYASVEVRRDPSLAGRPVLVGWPGPRGVVTSASYEARRRGCRSAMPMGQAIRRCPDAVVIRPDFDAYQAASRQVMALFRGVTPLVEPLSLDEAFMDVAAARRLAGTGPAVAAALRARVLAETGLSVTVGVAASKFLAKLGSSMGKPDGLMVIPPSRAVPWLHQLGVGVLWGVGEATMAVLARYGLATVGDLARTPLATLEAALGKAAGRRLHDLAWGRDDRQVEPDQATKSVSAEETFETDIADPAVLDRELLRCAVKVGRRLRAAALTGRTVGIKVRFDDFTTVTRARTLAAGVDGDAEIAAVAADLLAVLLASPAMAAGHWTEPGPERGAGAGVRPVRLLGVSAAGLSGVGDPVQLTLGLDALEQRPAEGHWEAVDRAADGVRARFGDAAVGPASLLAGGPAGAEPAEPRARRDRR